MKTLNEWLNETRVDSAAGTKYAGEHFQNERVKCADGYTVSIQASKYHYCLPRQSFENVDKYTHFELGFLSSVDEELKEYAQCEDDLTDTVYPYVEREVVEALLAKHGCITGYQE